VELFASDAVDEAAAKSGLGPRWGDIKDDWFKEMDAIFAEAQLAAPPAVPFLSTGKLGRHSEHMGFILTEMQYLQRAYPGGTW
jgi:ring-1,2-phenylacetyl-CoA epoxidase subunit PaaC